jgi:nucleoside-diphosphate-sugar epimerase
MRILVTGGTGFVGSHTARALARAGYRLRLLVRDRAKAQRVLGAHGVDVSDCRVGDVTDPDAVSRALEGCEGVVHAAAIVAFERNRAAEVLHTNARAAELVLGGARQRGLRAIVHVSSLSVLFSPGGPPIAPDAPLAAAGNAYVRSKTEAERFVRRLQAEGAPICTTYPPAVIGPDDPGLSVGNLAIQSLLRYGVALTSSGFQLVDVRDLAALHVALLAQGAAPGRYLAAGHFLTWRALADRIDALSGERLRRVRIPGPALRLFGRLGDAVRRVYPFDFPLTREAMEMATRWPGSEESTAVDALGIRFRDASETLADTLRWLWRADHLERRHVGRLATSDQSPRMNASVRR